MRTPRTYAIAAVLTLGCLIWATAAFAQSEPLRADIPFDFYVGDRLLPAGTYILTPAAHGNVIRVWDPKGSESAFVMTLASRPNHVSDLNRVTFNRYGNTNFLTGIYWVGYANGKQLRTSKMERQFAQNASAPISVAIVVR